MNPNLKREVTRLPFEQEFPLIRCACGQAYVLIAVFDYGQWIKQDLVDFCPYCGEKKNDQP